MCNFIGYITNQGNLFIIHYPLVISFICAELFFLLTKTSEIINIFKKNIHRTQKEKLQIEHGLKRSLLIEAALFVPASIVLFRLTVFPFIISILLQIKPDMVLWHATMGIAGYEFPFAVVRAFIERIALRTLKEFAVITINNKEINNKTQEGTNKIDLQ